MSQVIFDLAVVGTGELTEEECRRLCNKAAPDIYYPTENEVMLQVRQTADSIELTLLTTKYQIKQIHSKVIAITTYATLGETNLISEYEVLWAAGIRLDPVTLYPSVNTTGETSIKNIYCYEKKMAV